MNDAIFEREGDAFIPTENALSPWGSQYLHGGSAAALLAYGIEQAKADPSLMVTRMTIDLFRAVPRAPLRIETTPVRTGRRIQSLISSLIADGSEVARATTLLLLPAEVAIGDTEGIAHAMPERPENLPAGSLLPDDMRMSMRVGLHMIVEARRVIEYTGGRGGRSIAWLRFPIPVIDGVETTPLMRVAATADFANGISHIRPSDSLGFINADISLHLHREARGEWIGLDVTSGAQPYGIGMVRGTMFDTEGPIGIVTEALLANRRPI